MANGSSITRPMTDEMRTGGCGCWNRMARTREASIADVGSLPPAAGASTAPFCAPRVAIAAPDQVWERVAMPICEAPQVLKRNGDIFIVYSASASWTTDCCLGLLHNQTKDVLNPRAWIKHGPVFRKTDQVWSVGHCSFVKSLCQSEEWVIYHSKAKRRLGWDDPEVHARRFSWTSDGFPDFGTPVPRFPALTDAAVLTPSRLPQVSD